MKTPTQCNFKTTLEVVESLKGKSGNNWSNINPEIVARMARQNKFKTGF